MADYENVSEVWKQYENGVAYLGQAGLKSKLPLYVKFYEGEQWAAPTALTKNMPRPVINIIKMICRNKKAAILSATVRIVYEAEDKSVDTQSFNRFADYIQKEIGQDALDSDAIASGTIKGGYFYHYYWDSEARGKDGTKEGALRCELIDPLDIVFSDPTQLDEQKQEWIILASRENVEGVRAKADKGVPLDDIKGDSEKDAYGSPEQEGTALCTVLTKYFRKNGEVYWERAVKSTVVNSPRPLAPDIEAAKRALSLEDDIDAPNNALPDPHDAGSLASDTVKAHLYPIVVGNYERKEKCIYGLGEVQGLIPNQKAINLNIAMSLYSIQQTAWGKYIVFPNALGSQRITNEPGQVLVNYAKVDGAIKKLTEQALPSQPMNIVDSILSMTRNVTGATEVMTGEAIGANMSGSAIAQLQSQAQMPIEDLRKAFWQVKKKQGLVLAQFFKLYYQGKEFSYRDEGSAVLGQDAEVMQGVFNGSDFAGVEFDVVVETTKGTNSSSAGDIGILDVLLKSGAIDARGYVNAYPVDAISNKSELLAAIDAKEQSQVGQLTMQNEQLTAQVQSLQQVVQQSQATMDKVTALIEENTRKDQFIMELYAKFRALGQLADRQIQQDKARLDEVTGDAMMFAGELAKGRAGNVPASVPVTV